ncbi:MAG: hypothetical protein WCK98_04045 [bacterium]
MDRNINYVPSNNVDNRNFEAKTSTGELKLVDGKLSTLTGGGLSVYMSNELLALLDNPSYLDDLQDFIDTLDEKAILIDTENLAIGDKNLTFRGLRHKKALIIEEKI